jgi:hypothetical protein
MLPMSKKMSEVVDEVINSIASKQQELIQKKEDAMPDINNDAIVENFVVPETLNQKTEAQIETAIENALVGIDKYINIMDSLHTVNVSTDADFQRRYNGFYRMRQRTAQWYQNYYTYLENNKNNRDLSFNKVLDYLYENTNTCSPSFSSKFVATINPDKPIWDQWILKNTGHHEPRYGQADRVPMTNAIYQSMENWYAGFLNSTVGKNWLQIFNNNVPAETANKITDLKKIDFILWQIR